MKYLGYISFTVLGLCLLAFAPGKKERKVKPVQKALFGHVQSIREVAYHAIEDSSGNITKGDVISDTVSRVRSNEMKEDMMRPPSPPSIELWTYDEYGSELEDAKCHANGKLYNKETHSYYENGDVKEIIDSTFPERGPGPNVRVQQYTYKYDPTGSEMLVSNYWDYFIRNNGHPNFKRIVNFYDSSGKVREVMNFNADTVNPSSITWSTYNEKGKLVETDERKVDGNPPAMAPFEKNDYWYDSKGRMYDKATYKPNTGLVKDEKISFDSSGKTIVTYNYAAGKVLIGRTVKQTFIATGTTQEDTYDGDGYLTDYSISHDSARHLMDKGVFHITYKKVMGEDHKNHNSGGGDTVMVHHIVDDNHFNTVEDDTFTNDGKPISEKSFQYNYDNTGNWIGKVQFNNNKAVKIVEREIVYFQD